MRSRSCLNDFTARSPGQDSSQLKAEKTELGHGRITHFSIGPQRKQQQLLSGHGRELLKHSHRCSFSESIRKQEPPSCAALISPSNKHSEVTVQGPRLLSCTSETLASLHAPPLLPGLLRGTTRGSMVFAHSHQAVNAVMWMYPWAYVVVGVEGVGVGSCTCHGSSGLGVG